MFTNANKEVKNAVVKLFGDIVLDVFFKLDDYLESDDLDAEITRLKFKNDKNVCFSSKQLAVIYNV